MLNEFEWKRYRFFRSIILYDKVYFSSMCECNDFIRNLEYCIFLIKVLSNLFD